MDLHIFRNKRATKNSRRSIHRPRSSSAIERRVWQRRRRREDSRLFRLRRTDRRDLDWAISSSLWIVANGHKAFPHPASRSYYSSPLLSQGPFAMERRPFSSCQKCNSGGGEKVELESKQKSRLQKTLARILLSWTVYLEENVYFPCPGIPGNKRKWQMSLLWQASAPANGNKGGPKSLLGSRRRERIFSYPVVEMQRPTAN